MLYTAFGDAPTGEAGAPEEPGGAGIDGAAKAAAEELSSPTASANAAMGLASVWRR